MIHFVVPAAQQGWILEYLDFWGRGLLGRMRVLSYEGTKELFYGAFQAAWEAVDLDARGGPRTVPSFTP